jgi:two-component system sensor histidine kinase DesK
MDQGWLRTTGRRLLVMYVWLAALGLMVPTIVSGEDDPAWLASAALLGFAGLYVVTTWLVSNRSDRSWLRLLSLGALAVVTVAASVAFGEVWLLLFLFLSVACAVSLRGAWAVVAIFATTAVTCLVAVGKPLETGGVVSWTIGPFFAGFLNLYIRRTQELICELRHSQEELARLAVTEERLRFARDLHDLLGHTLSVIVVKAEAVRRLVPRDPDAAASQAADIEVIGRQAVAEIREAVSGYRRSGLHAELGGARSALSDAGISTTINAPNSALTPETDDLFAWVLREGTTNVLRHSRARHCEIDVARNDDYARLRIYNDGVTTNSSEDRYTGSGLRGIAERVANAGGCMNAGPTAGGYALEVNVPFATERAGQPA